MIFIDTNVLYHILHVSDKTEDALTLLGSNPGSYAIDTIVHNEILYSSTVHYLEHKCNIRGSYTARKWIIR